MSVSTKPQPLKTEWHVESEGTGEIKEELGGRSIFHWHHGTMMRRVITVQRFPAAPEHNRLYDYCRSCSSWICPKCQRREHDDAF